MRSCLLFRRSSSCLRTRFGFSSLLLDTQDDICKEQTQRQVDVISERQARMAGQREEAER